MSSAVEHIEVNRSIDDVWRFVSDPASLARVFTGVVPVIEKGASAEGVPEQVVMKGSLEGREFSSNLVVQERDDTGKRITYISERSAVEIGLKSRGDRTIIELTVHAFTKSRFLSGLYARSLKGRIQQAFED